MQTIRRLSARIDKVDESPSVCIFTLLFVTILMLLFTTYYYLFIYCNLITIIANNIIHHPLITHHLLIRAQAAHTFALMSK